MDKPMLTDIPHRDPTSLPSGCAVPGMQRLVDRHFAGRIRTEEEHRLRGHLTGCAACTRYYERHLLLAELDPCALPREVRLGRGLGIAARPRRLMHGAWLGALGAATVALVFFALPLWRDSARNPTRGFTARGGPANAPTELLIYRIQSRQAPLLVKDEVFATDELAMAYRNDDGKKWLLVFAVDEQKNVYWYHPAWTDRGTVPRAIALKPGPAVVELPEAVSHEFKGQTVTVYGVFGDDRLAVTEVERRVAETNEVGAPLSIPGAVQSVVTLRVRH